MGRKKNVSVVDIARELNVSIAAVSKALNNLSGVSSDLRLKVLETAERIGYTKHLKSSMLNSYNRKMKFIVTLYGRIGGHLIEEIQSGVDPIIRKHGLHQIRYLLDPTKEIQNDAEKELFLKGIINESGIVGILACYVELSDVNISFLNKNNISVVMLENHTDFGKCVLIDNVQAAYKATSALIDLGRKQIGVIMPSTKIDHVWNDRLQGYKTALAERGLPYDPSLIIPENWVGVKEAEHCTKILVENNPEMDAILFGSDLQAYGGIKALRMMKKDIPGDIALIGFDDMAFNEVVDPSLSSVKQPIREMATMGIEMLVEAIEHQDTSHKSTVLETELVLRRSCPALRDYPDVLN